ncbi:MAG TPA: TonB-dependent receptor [Cyclobacteriaceae bacterium]|nr:TonB-dependent receptor [Cyclobacteriaceae bacterium]
MRAKTFTLVLAVMCTGLSNAQDSLSTTYLKEVVTTGTRFDVPVEKSGKTIYKLTAEELERNAGKSLADLLNEVPGVQMDGNFGSPGTNVSYFVRGARNRQTLILIDGVPLNDPSSVNAEYDLRYLPVSQIESVEVLKGGLSTLYGTGAAAGVINIRLKEPGDEPLSGSLRAGIGSYKTYEQDVTLGGTTGGWSYMVTGSNITSEGFSAAFNDDPNTTFDDDGFSRQNVLAKVGHHFTPAFVLDLSAAFERFRADYDDYEFTDAPNVQRFQQYRFGVHPKWTYGKGHVEGRLVFNANERTFESNFPADYDGRNLQAEVINQHRFSNVLQGLYGVNIQRLAFDEEGVVLGDTARMSMVDPYVSLLAQWPSGLTIHAGARLNTHSVYGSKFVYNINPSYLFTAGEALSFKILASFSTSYITPSVYQLYSIFGNRKLNPEETENFEAGFTVYGGTRWELNFTWFRRNELHPIDFVSQFDSQGNYIGGKYENLADERLVDGVELGMRYRLRQQVSAYINYSHINTDKPESFYRIPKEKWAAGLTLNPLPHGTIDVKYSYTGDRTLFDFNSFSEVTLDAYQLVDIFVSYGFANDRLTCYGAVNNLFDEDFIAVLGYTTRGRNYSMGVRYRF